MSDKPAIIVDHVSMKFNLSKEKVDSLKDYVCLLYTSPSPRD